MADVEDKSVGPQDPGTVSLSVFLESEPPGSNRVVTNASRFEAKNQKRYLCTPELHLHCTSDSCNGLRFWTCRDTYAELSTAAAHHFLRYTCRNCQKTSRSFALLCTLLSEQDARARIVKIGEWPAFGPPTPAKLISMIGPDRETFLSGRRCENQGLGIGAFAYYRRVVENQKTRIIDEMIRVGERVGASSIVIEDLRAARRETQFSKSVELIKHGIPDSLMVKGRNPLNLLHSALSEGLHAQDDGVCLDLARSIRVVLAELAERMGQALRDDAELTEAVNRLSQSKAPPVS